MNQALPAEKPSLNNAGKIVLALAIFGITFFTVMGATGFYCYSLPSLFYSRVKIELYPDSHSLQDPSAFLPAPFQALQSKEVLYPVIDHLKLVENWSRKDGGDALPKEEVYRRLVGSLSLTPIRNTNIIEIGVLSQDRVEAANVANMIAVIYQKQRRDKVLEKIDEGLSALRQEVSSQRQATRDSRIKLSAIRAQTGFTDPDPESMDAPLFNAPQNYTNAKSLYLRSKHLLETAESRLSTESLQLKQQVTTAKIWEKAEPSTDPASPSRAQIMAPLTAGAVTAFFLGSFAAGIFLLFSFRRV